MLYFAKYSISIFQIYDWMVWWIDGPFSMEEKKKERTQLIYHHFLFLSYKHIDVILRNIMMNIFPHLIESEAYIFILPHKISNVTFSMIAWNKRAL